MRLCVRVHLDSIQIGNDSNAKKGFFGSCHRVELSLKIMINKQPK